MLKTLKSILISLGRSLPAGLKKSLVNFSSSSAPDEFADFVYLYGNTDQTRAMRQIAARGFTPQTVVDVGAYRGHWSEMVCAIWPAAKIIMVEPNAEHSKVL